MSAFLNIRFSARKLHCGRNGNKIVLTNQDGFDMGFQVGLRIGSKIGGSVSRHTKYPWQYAINLEGTGREGGRCVLARVSEISRARISLVSRK